MEDDIISQNPFKLNIPFEEALERYATMNTKELIDTKEHTKGDKKASPFVKWVGGKRSLIKELIKNTPNEFNNYYEPFVGGGALFFALFEGLNKSYLSDTNFDLVITYRVIQKEPKRLLNLLKTHAENHNQDYYYKIRSQHSLSEPIEITARFIYLNKTCYNGLYRVNKSGQFNVPFGRYTEPNIIQESNILACNKVLQSATIEYKQFDKITPQNNDFVYFDPPYHPTDENSFTTYTKSNFTETDQVRLRDFALKLHKKGVKIMLSNSNTKFIKDLYSIKPFNVKVVNAPRFVNCKSDKRNAVEELLITSY